jgi:hypothetical protein
MDISAIFCMTFGVVVVVVVGDSGSLSQRFDSLGVFFFLSCRTSKIVTDAELKFLMEILDENQSENHKWESVIDKRNNQLCYNAKCCKPKVTHFIA